MTSFGICVCVCDYGQQRKSCVRCVGKEGKVAGDSLRVTSLGSRFGVAFVLTAISIKLREAEAAKSEYHVHAALINKRAFKVTKEIIHWPGPETGLLQPHKIPSTPIISSCL